MNIRHLSFAYGNHLILKDVSLSFAPGKITTLLGANGSGKSTLFNCCTRHLRPQKGIIDLDDVNIFHYKQKDFARKVAIVHQQNRITGDITVRDLVSYGRSPYLKLMARYGEDDERAVEEALSRTNLQEVADRQVFALSGGQRQRVWIAMALAQESEYLFLDEPTTYLDVRYQADLLHLIKDLNARLGLTVVMILHDINQAVDISDELIGMKKGRVLFQGQAEDVITSEAVTRLYDTPLEVVNHYGRTLVLSPHIGHQSI
ncbi:ABC transporter ATP-binding protein [Peptococcus simiae]|uniref:ABC transporter ATP-binding protein n=1 Tax=Peptococcus simiae TaxID=1643805 RepID=UPI0039803D65